MKQHKTLANVYACCRWDLGLSMVHTRQVHVGHLVSNQVHLVVDQLDLELHVVELQEDFLASFMVVQQNSAHHILRVPIDVHIF